METFGRYQLHDMLGQGGMGVVYRAFDTVLERVVALKLVLTPGLEAEARERFFREARAAGHLSHKNIVTIYDLGEEAGRPYIAMEYLDGEDLQKRLARPEKMSLRRKLDLAVEVCEGLEYAHSNGVVHRDLKPANVYITDRGHAKILDFGLARLLTSQLTQSNMLMGTLSYMAPEQVRGDRADQRSDIFSMGVVLYELLGGRKAFEGDSAGSTLYKILQDVPEPLSKIDPALPLELEAIIDKALAKLRDERYPDATTLRLDLQAFRDQYLAAGGATPPPVPVGARPLSAPPSTASLPVPSASVAEPLSEPRAVLSTATILVAAGAVLLAAAGGWFFFSRSSPPPAPPPVDAPAATVEPADDSIATGLRAAQSALDAHQFTAALNAADAVLMRAPQNAAARRLRTAAREAALADALERGSRHLRDGATTEAIQAAGEALALAPDNAEARRILAGAQMSGPDADAARARMSEGRSAAEAAGAARHATSALSTALRAQQDGDRLYKAKRFAEAASRYYQAGGLYQGAAVTARSVAAAQAAAARAAQAPGSPGDSPPPSPAIAPPAPVPPTPPPLDAPAVSAPQAIPGPTVPPATIPSPPPPAESPQPVSAEERINELVVRYKEALESRSFDQVKRLWPSLAGSAESALRQEFQHARQITVAIADPQVVVSNNAGKVTFIRTYSILTVEGQRLHSTAQAVMDVHRAGTGWVIDAIRFTPR